MFRLVYEKDSFARGFVAHVMSLSPAQSPKLEDHPLSVVRYGFFYISVATLIFRPLPEEAPSHGDMVRLITKCSCRVPTWFYTVGHLLLFASNP
jgi:hypothetical protein